MSATYTQARAARARRVALASTIRTHRRGTGRQFAVILGVSLRTIYRDVIELQAAGVPIVGKPSDGYVYRRRAS